MVEWSSNFEVGIEEIDDHHRALVDMVDRLRLALVRNAGAAEIGEVLRQLERTTLAHFADEEERMASAGYSGLEDHRANHRAFARRITHARERHDSGEAVGLGLVNMIRSWMFEHVERADREFAEYLVASPGWRSPLRRLFKRFAV